MVTVYLSEVLEKIRFLLATMVGDVSYGRFCDQVDDVKGSRVEVESTVEEGGLCWSTRKDGEGLLGHEWTIMNSVSKH